MRPSSRQNVANGAVTAGFILIGAGALIGMFAGPAAVAQDNDASATACREEVWRVSAAPKGANPKYTPLPRYEQRTVIVCDEKYFAELRRRISKEG